ncbi:hypothetical protein FSB08_27040 [Paraburkholderia sp. JPY432]|uniref:hypothetical protein n=1 Tax=Paraburkholderia TaxID=1822464 RepID=UPI001595B492|nr:hypothetical protein [Paraburkholderia youngii]NVH76085.1 hypothetical protein [Paraburkholderia youngii]
MASQITRLTRFDRVLLSLLAFYCLSEALLEIVCSDSCDDIVSILIAKAAWMTLIAGTFFRRRLAARLLAFLCVVSAIVVGLTLPDMARTAPPIFSVLAVAVLLKFATFVRIAVQKPQSIEPATHRPLPH